MTYYLNRLQSLDSDVDWCLTLNGDVAGRARRRPRRLRAPALHRRQPRRPARAAVARGRPSDVVRRRTPRQRVPRGRSRLGCARRRGRSGSTGEVRDLRGHADARPPRAGEERLHLSGLLLAARPRRAARARSPAGALLARRAERRLLPRQRPLRRRDPLRRMRCSSSSATNRSSVWWCSRSRVSPATCSTPSRSTGAIGATARSHAWWPSSATPSVSACPRCSVARGRSTSTTSGCTSRRSSGSTSRTNGRSRSPATASGRASTSARTAARPLTAVLHGRRRELTNASVARSLVRYPLMPLQVTALIHRQALSLWLKRVPFHHKPPFVPGQGSVRA